MEAYHIIVNRGQGSWDSTVEEIFESGPSAASAIATLMEAVLEFSGEHKDVLTQLTTLDVTRVMAIKIMSGYVGQAYALETGLLSEGQREVMQLRDEICSRNPCGFKNCRKRASADVAISPTAKLDRGTFRLFEGPNNFVSLRSPDGTRMFRTKQTATPKRAKTSTASKSAQPKVSVTTAPAAVSNTPASTSAVHTPLSAPAVNPTYTGKPASLVGSAPTDPRDQTRRVQFSSQVRSTVYDVNTAAVPQQPNPAPPRVVRNSAEETMETIMYSVNNTQIEDEDDDGIPVESVDVSDAAGANILPLQSLSSQTAGTSAADSGTYVHIRSDNAQQQEPRTSSPTSSTSDLMQLDLGEHDDVWINPQFSDVSMPDYDSDSS